MPRSILPLALAPTGQPTPEFLDERARTFGALRRLDPILQIRSRMRELGLKNTDLAIRMGGSEANVSRLLKGEQNLRLDTLYRLADALNTPLTLLIAPLDEAPAPTSQVTPSGAANVRPRPASRRHDRRTETLPSLSPDDAGAVHPVPRSVLREALGPREPSVPRGAWYDPIVDSRSLVMLNGWLAQAAMPNTADMALAAFVGCLREGWPEGAQAIWSSRRMNFMEGLLAAWSDGNVQRRDLVVPFPAASEALLDRYTWDPEAAQPFTAKAQALVWPRALQRTWSEGRYDRWHTLLQRSLNLHAGALRAMRQNVWHDVYTDLHAPEHERARAVRALNAARLPLTARVVSMAYADQDPLLDVLLDHPAPDLDTLQVSLLLCQAGVINRNTTVPLAQREAFEATMLTWGAEPVITITLRDLDRLGPEQFFSAGYVRVDGPRGHRQTTWQAGHIPPILQVSRANRLSPARRDDSETVCVGAHWRAALDWDPARLGDYAIEFEQRCLRAVMPSNGPGVSKPRHRL